MLPRCAAPSSFAFATWVFAGGGVSLLLCTGVTPPYRFPYGSGWLEPFLDRLSLLQFMPSVLPSLLCMGVMINPQRPSRDMFLFLHQFITFLLHLRIAKVSSRENSSFMELPAKTSKCFSSKVAYFCINITFLHFQRTKYLNQKQT